MDYINLGYLGLFLICFLAATILPFTSEGVLILFLAASYDPLICLIVATTGNSLGGLTNYGLGMLGKPSALKKIYKNPGRYTRMVNAVDKYGYWLGLLSWVPFIGDPLTIALGFFRVRFFPFLLLMIIGKFLRYFLLIFIWNQ